MESAPRPFEILDANLRATLAIFALAKTGGDILDAFGLSLVCSGVRYSMFNTATLTAPVVSARDFEKKLVRAAEFFRRRGLPWSLWLCGDWIPPELHGAVEAACASFGLEIVAELPGMEAGRLTPPAHKLPPLECVRVSDAETRAAFNSVMWLAFGVPQSVSREIYESESTWRGALEGYVGYLDGDPICTTATLVNAGVIGVYAVGTLPAYQRRGCGEMIMRHALREAQARYGLERTILESSAAGYSLYERMGYRTITQYVVYARA